MANYGCHFDWIKPFNCLGKHYFWVYMRMLLEEIAISVKGPESGRSDYTHCGQAPSTLHPLWTGTIQSAEAWKKQKAEGRHISLPLLELRTSSSPVLGLLNLYQWLPSSPACNELRNWGLHTCPKPHCQLPWLTRLQMFHCGLLSLYDDMNQVP
jgi:hypothetical protein